jgi:iron complex outermembrane receptor protein
MTWGDATAKTLSRLIVALGATSALTGTAQAQAEPTNPADIVVTAQKRAESVQDVPISIAVLPAGRLQDEGVKDLLQAAPLVPGMIFSRAPDDGLGLSFRGLGTISRSAELEQPISMLFDGVPIVKGRLYTTGIFDIDRIEFIKGSESSLVGKNSSIGAISIVDRQPGDKLSVDASASREFLDGGYTLDAGSTLPLSTTSSLRVAAHWNDLTGWVHNDALDTDGPRQKDLGLRAILRSDLTETFRLTGSYQYADNRQIGQSMQLVGDIPSSYGDGKLNDHLSESSSYDSDGTTYHSTRSNIASVKGELKLGEHTLSLQSSYVSYHLHYLDDLDFSSDDTVNFLRQERYHQFAEELRLQSASGRRLSYMAGFFMLDSHWHSLETQYWSVPDFPPPPDPASGQLFYGNFVNDFSEHLRTYAGYASGSWQATDRLKFAGGVRYSDETKNDVFGRTPVGTLTIWNTIANPPFDPTPLRHHSDFLDGNFDVQYRIRPDVSAYASFGHGSTSGGFIETNTVAVSPSALIDGKVPAALVNANASLRDETANSYEIGLKTLLFDKRLRLNLAAFWTDIHDFQDNVFTGGALGFITFNGPARSRGFEVDSTWHATSRLNLDIGLTYADATAVIQPIDSLRTPRRSMPLAIRCSDATAARRRRS